MKLRLHKRAEEAGIALALVLMSLGAGAAPVPWSPPVGIPAPPFGITNSHWALTNLTYDFGKGPTNYPVGTGGPYTHYVDVAHPNATDADNPFGTAQKPRKTIPWAAPDGSVVAGSVIEIHNGPYNVGWWMGIGINGNGTKDKPIYFRGASGSDRPIFTERMTIWGNFLVLENLVSSNTVAIRQDVYANTNVNSIVIRHCEFAGAGTPGWGTAIAVGTSGDATRTVSNTVVYHCKIHDYGDRFSTQENDIDAVKVMGAGVYWTWILDNESYHMSSDSFGPGAQSWGEAYQRPNESRYCFIGRNHIYDNRESAIDIKVFRDVVVSENKMHGFRACSSGNGAAVITHYDPENVWVINNEFWDCTQGLMSSGVTNLHVIGNVFHDVEAAAVFWGGGRLSFINNTMVNCGAGIYAVSGGSLSHTFVNNLFANIATNAFISIADGSMAAASTVSSNLFHQSNGVWRVVWGIPVADAARFNSAARSDACVVADPRFVNAASNFRLQSNSPARKAGAEVSAFLQLYRSSFGDGLNLAIDIAGTPRQAPWDIGAYEYRGASGGAGVRPNPPGVLKSLPLSP